MPFDYDCFYQDKEEFAFAILMKRYNISMGEAQKIIDYKRLICNDSIVTQKNIKISGKMKVLRFIAKPSGNKPIFKNSNFLIFDKPSGILVHPKKIDVKYSLLDDIRGYGTIESNACHRIDKETSGLVLASMSKEDEIRLKKMFEAKEIKKSYLAWVRGNTKEYFEVEEPIKIRRDYSTSKHKVEISKDGKYAKTIFKKIKFDKANNATLLEVFPLTGRTHQIRIHLFHVKHPIIGDPLYGVNFNIASDYLDGKLSLEDRVKYTGAKRLMLHAWSLEFTYRNRFFIKSRMKFEFSDW